MAFPKVDLTGKKFGHLEVLFLIERNKFGNSRWMCACECGEPTEGYYQHLVQGEKRSCGKCGLIKRGMKKGAKRKKKA